MTKSPSESSESSELTESVAEDGHEHQHGDLIEFYAGLPHRMADAGLSADEVTTVADLLEDLVQDVESAGYPPVDVDGPDPERFSGGAERIAAASNQLEGLLVGLDPLGWDSEAGGTTVADRCQRVRDRLISDHGFQHP